MSSKLCLWLLPYPELVENERGVFCTACGKTLPNTKKHLVDQHCRTLLHQRNVVRAKSVLARQTLSAHSSVVVKTEQPEETTFTADICKAVLSNNIPSDEEAFNVELCKAILSAGIPLHVLNNATFKAFLEKYLNRMIPDADMLRSAALHTCYMQTIAQIKHILLDNYIYVAFDETTDTSGRYIANLLVGTLSAHSISEPFLIAVKHLETINYETIARFIQVELANIFLPNAIPSTKLVLLLSDAQPYIVKGGTYLKVLYPNLIHCTCLVRGVNRVIEQVQRQFRLVCNFVDIMSEMFVKAPLRVQLYKEILPNVALPPEVNIARPVTWLHAALFYCKYCSQLKEIICKFDDDAYSAIADLKRIVNNPQLSEDLSFINKHYALITETLTELEKLKVPLSKSVMFVSNLQEKLKKTKDFRGEAIAKKLDEVVGENEGFAILTNVIRIFNGEYSQDFSIDPKVLACLKYAPIISVDVEHVFSTYTHTLNDQWQSYEMDILEKEIIVKVNSNIL